MLHDSGANVAYFCICPMNTDPLISSTSVKIGSFGATHNLDIGLGGNFQWIVFVAEVSCPIMDFECNLYLDLEDNDHNMVDDQNRRYPRIATSFQHTCCVSEMRFQAPAIPAANPSAQP